MYHMKFEKKLYNLLCASGCMCVAYKAVLICFVLSSFILECAAVWHAVVKKSCETLPYLLLSEIVTKCVASVTVKF